jgi:hypothetical protein
LASDDGAVHVTTIDSCHSRWVFDLEKLRYRRVPQGPGLALRLAQAPWRPYTELHVDPDSDAFVVVLTAEGTRMLRSWRHVPGTCPQCGALTTEELSSDAIALVES